LGDLWGTWPNPTLENRLIKQQPKAAAAAAVIVAVNSSYLTDDPSLLMDIVQVLFEQFLPISS